MKKTVNKMQPLTACPIPPPLPFPPMPNRGGFQEQLRELINKQSLEGGSNTPDYVLAEYLKNCLDAFDIAVRRRDGWHGIKTNGISVTNV